jgi:very-short-patch-repair endonuclease
MSKTNLVLLAVGLACIAIAAAIGKQRSASRIETRRRRVMTDREQGMYWRLAETFPEHVVLAQVAFSALITSAREHRNRFDRKVADFVVCDKAMQVLAVVELDDASHKGREAADAKRAALLETAGYRVVRFPRTPDIDELRAAIELPAPTQPPPNRTSKSDMAK